MSTSTGPICRDVGSKRPAEPPPDLEAAALALAVRLSGFDVDGSPIQWPPSDSPVKLLWGLIDLLRSFARAAVHDGRLRDELEQAHAQGIVHRDLKPENIFLAASRREGGAVAREALALAEKKIAELTGSREKVKELGRELYSACQTIKQQREVIDELRAEVASRPAVDAAKLAAWREGGPRAKSWVIETLRLDAPAGSAWHIAADLLEGLQG